MLRLSVVLIGLVGAVAAAQDARTVVGPANVPLADGANALLQGDAEEGVRLTLQGLSMATSGRERVTALSNLCAGYAMLEKWSRALPYCDQALQQPGRSWRHYSNRALVYIKLQRFEEAETDLLQAEQDAPNSNKVKSVRAMLLDAIDPVTPTVVIDERRHPPAEQ